MSSVLLLVHQNVIFFHILTAIWIVILVYLILQAEIIHLQNLVIDFHIKGICKFMPSLKRLWTLENLSDPSFEVGFILGGSANFMFTVQLFNLIFFLKPSAFLTFIANVYRWMIQIHSQCYLYKTCNARETWRLGMFALLNVPLNITFRCS